MNRTIRRAAATTIAAGGALVLLTGTASAHFCYRTDVPAGSKMANGSAWSTVDQKILEVEGSLWLPEACRTAAITFIQALPENTLFMGPGLLAGGTAFNGKHNTPDGFGFLIHVPGCAPPPPPAV